MQKSILAIGLVAVAVLATMPAQGATDGIPAWMKQTYTFQLDPVALSQPGAMWSLGIDNQGNFDPKVVVPQPSVEIFGPVGLIDTCATVAPVVMTCSGLQSHTGFPGLVPFGVYDAALGTTRVDTIVNYGAAGKLTWSCFISGGIIGVFFFPPGSGFCRYTTFPTGFRGAWTLDGAQVGPGVVGPVFHTSF